MPRTTKPKFNLGDRVTWVDRVDPDLDNLNATLVTALSKQEHGVVVPYKSEKHKPTNPRVRWNDGWAYHVKSDRLRLLTEEEARRWPSPKLSQVDVR